MRKVLVIAVLAAAAALPASRPSAAPLVTQAAAAGAEAACVAEIRRRSPAARVTSVSAPPQGIATVRASAGGDAKYICTATPDGQVISVARHGRR